VAPAREVKAAVAARPQAASRPLESSLEEKQAKAPVDRESGNAKTTKAHGAPPSESHRQAAEAPAAHRQEPPRQAEHVSKPKPQSGNAKPVEKSHRQAEASRPAEHATKPKPQSGKEKQVEKDKKPDGEKP
jgi:hypothetical protein